MQEALAPPSKEETFRACKLDLRERIEHFWFYGMFKDLVRLRKADAVFSLHGQAGIDGAVLSDKAFVLRFFGPAAPASLRSNFQFRISSLRGGRRPVGTGL